jgi:hypothetical protein
MNTRHRAKRQTQSIEVMKYRFSTLLATLVIVALLGAPRLQAATDLQISWTNNMLTVTGQDLPGEKLEIWYLEAFCKSGSTKRNWGDTTIPHKTELVDANGAKKQIRLRTTVQPSIEVAHEIRAGTDSIDFDLTLTNRGDQFVDIDWFQPCMRVARFTGRAQTNYVPNCFIFTERGLTTLDNTRRTEEAIYRGGQVYVPAGINLDDVNPRPISPDKPVNGLIGAFSADNKQLVAMAWDQTQELFQGVIVCIHNDPRVGGLKPGEAKKLFGKVYIMKNDPKELLRRYEQDFKRR